jgi:type II secretory pathway pseudopilin PulG
LIELLIVVAIILVIASLAIPNLMRARIAANESAGAATVRSINTAEATYSTTYASIGYAPSLVPLGPNGVNCNDATKISPNNGCLLDNVLSCGATTCNKAAFAYTISSKNPVAPVPDYFVKAISLGSAVSEKDYCSGNDEVVHFQPHTGTDIGGISVCSPLGVIQ